MLLPVSALEYLDCCRLEIGRCFKATAFSTHNSRAEQRKKKKISQHKIRQKHARSILIARMNARSPSCHIIMNNPFTNWIERKRRHGIVFGRD